VNTLLVDTSNTDSLAYRAWTPGARWRSGFVGDRRKKLTPLEQATADASKATGVDAFDIKFVTRRT
jgi:hypothetical protein